MRTLALGHACGFARETSNNMSNSYSFEFHLASLHIQEVCPCNATVSLTALSLHGCLVCCSKAHSTQGWWLGVVAQRNDALLHQTAGRVQSMIRNTLLQRRAAHCWLHGNDESNCMGINFLLGKELHHKIRS